MSPRGRALCAAGLLGALPALAADLPLTGSQGDVRYRFGIPDAIRFDAAGAQAWEYRGWRQAFVVQFDNAGNVAGSRALRTEEEVAKAVSGRLSAREALDLLGEPHRVVSRPEGLVWTYRQPSGATLSVSFGADGRVSGAATGR